jgi:hypothetical protein
MTDSTQILLGWVSDFIGVLFFGKAGELLDTAEFPLGIDLRKGLGPAVEAIAEKKIRYVKRLLRFRSGAIHVQPFSVDKWGVRLKLFPDDLEEFLVHPDWFEDEADLYGADLEKWREDGNCVLEWGNSYHLNKDGLTM